MTEFAQRPHCIVAFPGTGTWMAPSDAVIQFLSNEQIKEMEEDGYPATPEHEGEWAARFGWAKNEDGDRRVLEDTVADRCCGASVQSLSGAKKMPPVVAIRSCLV